MLETKFVRRRPSLRPADFHHTIPIGFHGDGGSITDHGSLYVFSWDSFLGADSTIQTRFLFTVIRGKDLLPGTIGEILRIFSWSVYFILKWREPV